MDKGYSPDYEHYNCDILAFVENRLHKIFCRALSCALRRCWHKTLIGSTQATGYAGGLDYLYISLFDLNTFRQSLIIL